MTREQALNYLKSSGFSEEQIQAIVEALSGSENFSSGTRKNSQKLENASPIIDWNNCHTSEQLNSISTPENDLEVDNQNIRLIDANALIKRLRPKHFD